MTKRDIKEKVFYITHKGELLFWLIIIMFIVALSSTGIIFKEKHDDNDYQIFLQDVDGLIVGSPVRMMGIEVGYVTKIKPTKDEVYVKFILTNPDVTIPQGTNVTVEFSGMAGSKSLELYLPDKNTYVENSTPVLSVMPPKRLHDALGLLNDMFKKLASISYTASSFGTKLDSTGIKSAKDDIFTTSENFKDFLQYTNKFLEETSKNTEDLTSSLKRLKNGK
ncbi:MAG: MCE family protein [Cyanobacteria bacterium SIG31]|nr:MCE family protein [Cyanobacteria bacterium SIG31]